MSAYLSNFVKDLITLRRERPALVVHREVSGDCAGTARRSHICKLKSKPRRPGTPGKTLLDDKIDLETQFFDRAAAASRDCSQNAGLRGQIEDMRS